MEKNNFWNDAARCGAILGVLLSLSFVVETYFTLSGKAALYTLYLVEWLTVVGLHYYLLHRYTRSRSRLYTASEGFSFMQGYTFVLCISAFAGIIQGVVTYIFQHVVIGYDKYIEMLSNSIVSLTSVQQGTNSSVMEQTLFNTISMLEDAPEPTLLQVVWSGLFTSLLFGAIFGLIIAGTTSCAPRPFDTELNEQDDNE